MAPQTLAFKTHTPETRIHMKTLAKITFNWRQNAVGKAAPETGDAVQWIPFIHPKPIKSNSPLPLPSTMTTLLSLCVRCVPGAVPPSLHCAPFTSSAVCATAASKRLFPRRIILLRHGESQGNANELVYGTTPDWR